MKLLEYAKDISTWQTVKVPIVSGIDKKETLVLRSVGKSHSPIEWVIIFLLMTYGVMLQFILFGFFKP